MARLDRPVDGIARRSRQDHRRDHAADHRDRAAADEEPLRRSVAAALVVLDVHPDW
jgi:hypothetical protein